MAAQQALASAFANQPGQVTNPVPGEQAEEDFFGDLVEQAPAQVNSPDLAGGEGTMVQEMSQVQGDIRAQSQGDTVFADLVPTAEGAPTEDVQVEDEPGFLDAQFPDRQLIESRLVAAIPKTVGEKQQALENFLGAKNVRKDADGEFLVKFKGKEKFQKLDPDTFELFNDMFTDNAREVLRGMGGTAGVAVQGPAAAEPVSSAVGFALGAAAGDLTADAISEQVLGVNRDTGRVGTSQSGDIGPRIGAGIERTLEAIQTGLTDSLFKSVSEVAFKNIAKTIAARSARKATLKHAKEIPVHKVLNESVQDNLDTMDDLIRSGTLKPLPGTNTPLLAHQVLPGVQKVDKLASSVAGNQSFQNMQDQASKQMGDTLLDVVEGAADLTEGSLKKVVREGVKSDRTGLAAEAKNLLATSLRNEGKLIETFRKKAKSVASKAALPSPKVEAALLETFQDLGVQRRGGELIFPDDDTMAQLLGTDSKMIINGVKKDILRLSTSLATKGGMTIDELIGESQLMGAKNKAAGRIGGIYKKVIGKLSSQIRADTRDVMPLVLDPADAAAYTQSMNKYSSFAQSRDQLRNLLKQDMGANTFSRLLLSKGKNGLAQLKSAKEFMLSEDPAVWNKVQGEFFEELALKHRQAGDPSKIEYNVKGMRKELASYGKEFLDEMFDAKSGLDTKTVLKTFDLAEQVRRTSIHGSDDQLKKVGKEAVQGLSSFISAKVNAVWAIANFGGQNGRLLKLMSRDGVEEFLERVPKNKKGAMRQLLSDAIDYAGKQKMIQQVGGAVAAGAGQAGQAVKGIGQAHGGEATNQFMQGIMSPPQPEPPRR